MIIADSNVLIDILDGDPQWSAWSLSQLQLEPDLDVCINPVIYAEIAPQFANAGGLDDFLRGARVGLRAFSSDELFAAGHAHKRYRANGGERRRVLADFLIGAQALITGRAILTRDARLFRTYFPDVRLITP